MSGTERRGREDGASDESCEVSEACANLGTSFSHGTWGDCSVMTGHLMVWLKAETCQGSAFATPRAGQGEVNVGEFSNRTE